MQHSSRKPSRTERKRRLQHKQAIAPAPPDTWMIARGEARLFDLTWQILLLYALFFAVLCHVPQPISLKLQALNNLWFILLATPLALVLDALVAACLGNTPGKVLKGITVRNAKGYPLDFVDHLRRNMLCWVLGLGLLFPYSMFLTTIWQGSRLRSGQPTTYDAMLGCKVQCRTTTTLDIIATLILLALPVPAIWLITEWQTALAVHTPYDLITHPSGTWQNPLNRQRVKLDPAWWIEGQTDRDGTRRYTFNLGDRSDADATVDMQGTAVPVSIAAEVKRLQGLGRNLIESNPANVPADALQWEGKFDSYDSGERRLRLTRWQNGNWYWLVRTWQYPPYTDTDAPVQQLQTALQSTMDQPGALLPPTAP
ncbi:hypothetical protein IGB42_01874 [Andreprevotia sp. IGB-42]|uniref:RDD family protein n=1 Tax=Andreprevotia sp. IGB-42 TaxID=2497473 RepID=UPI00135B97C8|nr:RDD family protein [Andreprevotia sp. IGB-42]KAF0813523.1 hypothetical protein IGB42_01874 [Andreprevotia sp. IGB-42]